MSTTAPGRSRRLTDAQLEEMLALTSHADSVELKLTVPDSERRSTVASLGMNPLDAQIRQVFFFDTPTCASTSRGWSCGPAGSRAAATTLLVKLRPIGPGELPQPPWAVRQVAEEK